MAHQQYFFDAARRLIKLLPQMTVNPIMAAFAILAGDPVHDHGPLCLMRTRYVKLLKSVSRVKPVIII